LLVASPESPQGCRLSVVVPTYRAPDLAVSSVAGLLPVPSWAELLVVDDGSNDETAARVRERFPQIEVIELMKNRGFGGAVNAGFLRAHGRFLATLNNDARGSWEGFARVVDVLDAKPTAGAAAPALVDDDGGSQRVAFSFPSPLPARLLRLLRAPGSERQDEPYRTDYAKGACVVFRREALEQVGLFDEQYWMFAEEIDLFRRLAGAGWETWVVPAATVEHSGGRTTRNHPDRRESSRYRQQSYRSICRYWAKHHSVAGAAVLRAELIARVAARIVGATGAAAIGRGDRWWIGEHVRCLGVLLSHWPSEPKEPELPRRQGAS